MSEHLTITAEQRAAAKVAGALYLVQMAAAMFGDLIVRRRLIAGTDAARTAENILAQTTLFRLSIAGDLLVYTTVIVLIWTLYVVLRPVNRNVALLAVLFRLAETAVLCASTVYAVLALRFLRPPVYLQTFGTDQLQSFARLLLGAQGLTMNVGFILLGFGSAVFAWLFLKSGYIPKWIAGWGIFASLTLSLVTLAAIVFPVISATLGLTYMVPMFFYEVGLGLWLLTKGLHAPGGMSADPMPTR